jgi:hypothetical protein
LLQERIGFLLLMIQGHFLPRLGLQLSVFFCVTPWSGYGQCTNSTSYGSATAPTAGNTVTLTTCQYASEYATVTGVAATTNYQSTSSVPTDWITIRRGSSGGTLIAFGQTPLNWTSTVAGTYYVHCNATSACGTQSVCRTTALTATVPMSFGSSTTTQANTSPITKCSFSDKEIIGIQVVMNGTTTPLSLTTITVRTNGSTAPLTDISALRLYYTGTSNAFATTTLFGSAAPAAAGTNITINGSATLASGTNYFWLAYDITPTAVVGNVLDAQCTVVRVAAVNHTPTVTNPAGSRTIAVCPPSPGAVGDGLLVWLKANGGLTTSGVNVTGWANQSTSGISTQQIGSPDLQSAGRNYNPTVLFTQSNGVDGGDFLRTPDLNVQSFFCAARLQDTLRRSTHIVTYDGVTLSLPCSGCALHGGENGGLVAEYGELGYGNAQFQSAGVWRRNGNPTGIAYNTHHSGQFDVVGALGTGTGSVNVLLGGQNDNPGFFNGRVRDWLGPVGELILYSGAVTTAQANRVESYLAIKYGITLGGNGSTSAAYRSAASTVVWPAGTGYHYDVIGIGRDDASVLLQKQSQAPDDSTRLYLQTLAATNQANTGSFASDNSFVLMGRNTGKVCATTASNLEMPAGLYSRLEREWEVVNTNFNGTFGIDVKLAACAVPGMVTVGDLRLLVDNDGNFSNATVLAAGGGLTIAYSSGIVSVRGISTALVPQNAVRFLTIGSVDSRTPLPIELVGFTADCRTNKVALAWATASEQDNAFFTVERSTDGNTFEAMGNVVGAGNSTAMQHYAWTDQTPEAGVAYYRLTQTDFNGARTSSNVVPVQCAPSNAFSLLPDPASGGFTFLRPASELPLQVEIHNPAGQLVWRQNYPPSPQMSERLDVALPGLGEAIYFVRFRQGNLDQTVKFPLFK